MLGIPGLSCGLYVMVKHYQLESAAADSVGTPVEVLRAYDPGVEAACVVP